MPVKFHVIWCNLNDMKRSYEQKRRAEAQSQTRQKIVDATIELHQAKGIAATSINDVAERAKVAKVTVYRHFPNQEDLVNACSGQYFQRHPFPDPESWRQIKDPLKRFRKGLRETYAYHRATESMIARVLPEARDLPLMEPYSAHWQNAVEILAKPFQGSAQSDELLKAALALAVSFDTWRFLTRSNHLSDDMVIELMMRLVRDCRANTG